MHGYHAAKGVVRRTGRLGLTYMPIDTMHKIDS